LLGFMAVYGMSEVAMCAVPMFVSEAGAASGCAATRAATCGPGGCPMGTSEACCCDHPTGEGAVGTVYEAHCGCSAGDHARHDATPLTPGFRYLMPSAAAVAGPTPVTARLNETPGRSLAGHVVPLIPPPQSRSL
jgi:hypothetical protein